MDYTPGGAMGVKKEEKLISVELGYQTCGIFGLNFRCLTAPT